MQFYCQNISISSYLVSSNSSNSNNSVCISIVFVHTPLNVKTVLFQAIRLIIRTHFTSIRPIDRTLSGATTSDQSGSGSDANEEVLCISQNSSITGTSPSDCLVSYPGHSLVGVFYPPAEKQPQPTGQNTFGSP